MTKQAWECWAYVSPEGTIHATSVYYDEAHVWSWLFGMHHEEIQAAKQRGARVIRVRIEEITE